MSFLCLSANDLSKFDLNCIQSSSELLRYTPIVGFQSQSILVIGWTDGGIWSFFTSGYYVGDHDCNRSCRRSPVFLVGEGCSPHMTVNPTAFTDNPDSVLQSLLSNLSSDGFATSMRINSGKTDPVYGLAVCRKYLSARECSQCVKEAAIQAKAVCPQSNGARIHLDGCLLRYENNTFYSQDVDAENYVYCASTDYNDPSKIPRLIHATC